MSIDAGQLRTEAFLDVQQVDKASQAYVQNLQKMTAAAEKLPDVKPQLATDQFEKAAADARKTSLDLGGALSKLNEKNAVGLDVSGLKQAGGVADPILKGLSGGFLSLGAASAIGSTSLVAFSVAASAAVIKMGQDYAQAFRMVAAQTGASGPALESMNAALAKLSATSPKSIQDLAAAFIPLRQILPGTDAQIAATTSSVLKFSKVAGVDAAQAAGDLGRLFNAFGTAAADQPRFLDNLTVAMQKTGISEQALVAGLQAAGPTLRGFGLDAKEATAFVANLSTSGVDVSEVLRGLRAALGNVAGDQAKAQLTDLFTLLGDVGVDKTTRLQLAIANFGARTGPTLIDLAEKGQLSTATLTKAMDEGAGATDRAAAAMKTSFDKIGALIEIGKKQWAPYGLAAVEAMEQAGTAVFDGLGRAGTAIDEFLAKPSTRALVAYLQAIGRAGQEGTGPQPTAVPSPATPGQMIPIAPAPHLPGGATPLGGPDLERTQLELDNRLKRQGEGLRLVADAEGNLTQQTKEATVEAVVQALTLERLAGSLPKGASGLLDYAKAIEIVGKQHAELLPELLRRQQAQDDLDKGIAALTNLDVKAAAIALEFAAAQATGAEQTALLAQASELVASHLAAQTTAQARDQQATEAATATLKQFEDAMRRVADVAGNEYGKRLDALASTVLPDLNAATATTLQQALLEAEAYRKLGDATAAHAAQQKALAIIAAQLGKSQGEVAGAVEAGTPAVRALTDGYRQHAEATKDARQEVDQYAQLLARAANTATVEFEQRLNKLADATLPGLDLATVAQIKSLQTLHDTMGLTQRVAELYGTTEDELRALLQGTGSALDARVKQQQAVTQAMRETTEQSARMKAAIESATTFAATGRLVPAPAEPPDARRAFREEMASIAEARTALDRQLDRQRGDTARQDSASAAGFLRQQSDLDAAQRQAIKETASAREASRSQLGLDLAAAASAQTDALKAVTSARDEAGDAFNAQLKAANESIADATLSAQDTYGKAVEGLSTRAAEAVEATTARQRAALGGLADAMRALTDSQVQSAAQASITAQNELLKRVGLDPSSAPSGGTFGAKSLAQIQQEGLAALQATAGERQARAQIGSAVVQQNAAAAEADRAALQLAQEQQRAAEALRKTIADAHTAADKTVEKAVAELEKTFKKLGEQEQTAERQASQAANKAQNESKEREKKLNEAEDAARLQRERSVQDLVNAQREAQRAQDLRDLDARAQTRKALDELGSRERKAERELGRALELLAEGQAALADQNAALPDRIAEAVAARLQMGPQQVDIDIENLVETGVDFVGASNMAVWRRVRSSR